MDKKNLPDNASGQTYPEPDVPVEDAWDNMKQLLQLAPAAAASPSKFSFVKGLGAGRFIIGAGVVAIVAVITYVIAIKKEKPAPPPTQQHANDAKPGADKVKDTSIAYPAIPRSKTVSHEFSNTPFKEVASFLEKEYGITIAVKNEAINNCMVTTRFDNRSLGEILDILGYTLAFKYKIDEKSNQVIISGDGCN